MKKLTNKDRTKLSTLMQTASRSMTAIENMFEDRAEREDKDGKPYDEDTEERFNQVVRQLIVYAKRDQEKYFAYLEKVTAK